MVTFLMCEPGMADGRFVELFFAAKLPATHF
jgi:hypothetical protein